MEGSVESMMEMEGWVDSLVHAPAAVHVVGGGAGFGPDKETLLPPIMGQVAQNKGAKVLRWQYRMAASVSIRNDRPFPCMLAIPTALALDDFWL
jgi:hypothetical protein